MMQTTVAAVKSRLDAGEPTFLLDVRQPEEYAYCHLPGSVLIPLGELPRRVEEVQEAITPETLVVVYCHHGVRSISGMMILKQAGLEQAVSMSGGIDAWSLQIDPTVPRY